jgi:hypothetical protein
MTPQEMFIARLRRYRQRNAISLDEISGKTRVKRELLEAFENNDLSEWPRGLYARAWIRGYAGAVGLDPLDTVDEFCRLFPHGDRRAKSTIRELAQIVAAPSEYMDEFSHTEERRATAAGERPRAAATWHAPFVQAFRALWTKVATHTAPQARRGTPRPSNVTR